MNTLQETSNAVQDRERIRTNDETNVNTSVMHGSDRRVCLMRHHGRKHNLGTTCHGSVLELVKMHAEDDGPSWR